MIYWLSDLVGPVLGAGGLTPGIHAAENFGNAGYFGQHVVLGHRPDLFALASEPRLSERSRVYFRSTAERLTELAGLARAASAVRVSGSAQAPVKQGDEWVVPLNYFSDPDSLLPSCLVAEDENDLALLSAFANVWTSQEFRNCILSIRSVPGGGSNTFKVLRRQFKEHKTPVVCIVDSDRDLPDGEAKSTSLNCEIAFREESVEWRDVLYILSARELENLLPKSIVESLVASSREQSEKVANLHLVHRDLADFVDMKIGEGLCRFHELPEVSPCHARIFRALEETNARHAGFDGLENCNGGSSCAVIPSLGDNSLMRASQLMNSRASRTDHPVASWHHELHIICRLIFSSCVALRRPAV